MIERLLQLFSRLRGYSPLEVIIELAIICIVVYGVVRFLRGTRGAGVIKGLALILVVGTLGIRILGQEGESFERLNFLYDRALGFAAIALIVVFQPELRRALIRLGETQFFRSSRTELAPMIEAVVTACEFNSKNSFGALIAIERVVGLGGLVEGGTSLNADVSSRLLQSIFWPNSALHDLGVIIRGGQILAAGVQLPMAEVGELGGEFGARHRAAVGVTQDSDCLAVVVSEETGRLSVAERGQLYQDLTPDQLRRFLADRLLGDDRKRQRIDAELADLRLHQPAVDAEADESDGAEAASSPHSGKTGRRPEAKVAGDA